MVGSRRRFKKRAVATAEDIWVTYAEKGISNRSIAMADSDEIHMQHNKRSGMNLKTFPSPIGWKCGSK
jgi:hypothetical protein